MGSRPRGRSATVEGLRVGSLGAPSHSKHRLITRHRPRRRGLAPLTASIRRPMLSAPVRPFPARPAWRALDGDASGATHSPRTVGFSCWHRGHSNVSILWRSDPLGHTSCGQLRTIPNAKSFAPESYTPKHLAEKSLTSKTPLEGERKQVTVLFADFKGSMEMLSDAIPRRRASPHPVLETGDRADLSSRGLS
jgi:hypothetical protein